jgi:hypothetical protein
MESASPPTHHQKTSQTRPIKLVPVVGPVRKTSYERFIAILVIAIVKSNNSQTLPSKSILQIPIEFSVPGIIYPNHLYPHVRHFTEKRHRIELTGFYAVLCMCG